MKKDKKSNVLVLAYSDIRFDPRIMKQCIALSDAGYQVSFHGVRYSSVVVNEGFKVKLYFNRSSKRVMQYMQYFALMLIFFFVQVRCIYKKPIIIVHNMPNFLVIPSFFFRFFGSKIVLDMHDDSALVLSKVIKNKLLLRAFEFVENSIALKVPNKLMTVNRLLLHSISEKSGKDVLLLHNSPQATTSACSYSYIVGGPIKLVYVGHVGTHYGLEGFIEYIYQIKKTVPLTFDIYGDGIVREKIENLILKFELQETVKLHGRYLANDISEILTKYDLGVALYKKTELTDIILPVKILEYTFNCLPSLTLPLKVTQEYFRNESLIYINSFEDFKKSIEDIFTGKLKLKYVHINALEDMSGISWANEKQHFLDFIGKLND